VGTFVVMFGLVATYIENHFDGKAITCSGGADAYAKAYCWLHGTGYLSPQLQALMWIRIRILYLKGQ
jgi:hypothetical protein